jgi:serine/threonine protein kinase
MLYVTCGKHIVTRLQDSWQEDLAVLISAYESCHSKDKFTHQTWSVQQVLDTHFQEYPQAEALWKRIPQELSAIILLCLSVDPSARPSIHELLETPQYKALQCARNSDYSGAPKSKMNDDERELLRSHIDDLTMRLATREERMICLETLLATERDAHYRTSQLLEESNDKLEEALEKIKLLEVDDDEDNAKAQEPPIPTVVGLHHPGKL